MRYIKISDGRLRYEWNTRRLRAQCQNHPEAQMTLTEANQFASMERRKVPAEPVGKDVYSIEGLAP